MKRISKQCPSIDGQCIGKECEWFDVYADCCSVLSTPLALRQMHHTLRGIVYEGEE